MVDSKQNIEDTDPFARMKHGIIHDKRGGIAQRNYPSSSTINQKFDWATFLKAQSWTTEGNAALPYSADWFSTHNSKTYKSIHDYYERWTYYSTYRLNNWHGITVALSDAVYTFTQNSPEDPGVFTVVPNARLYHGTTEVWKTLEPRNPARISQMKKSTTFQNPNAPYDASKDGWLSTAISTTELKPGTSYPVMYRLKPLTPIVFYAPTKDTKDGGEWVTTATLSSEEMEVMK